MTVIPECVTDYPFTNGNNSEPVADFLTRHHYDLVHRGKVRDTYAVRDNSDKLLVVASDRLSIFDIVLPVSVPGKGAVLTALTHMWLTRILAGHRHHLVPSVVNKQFNAAVDHRVLAGPGFPVSRALVVNKVQIQPYELIWRNHLGGSVWKQYLETGVVAGIALPRGLKRWQYLDQPLFTPSTKSDTGHDTNVTQVEYLVIMGDIGRETVRILKDVVRYAYGWAYQRGIVILDTKLEAGNPFRIADEVLTPDSSRFTTVEDYEAAQRENRDPIFYDKEPVRIWGRTVPTPFGVTGINSLDPEKPDHVRFVHEEVKVPLEVINDLANRYRRIFEMLSRQLLYHYQTTEMGIAIDDL